MKLRFRFSPPRRADGTLLPAGLAMALAMIAAMQLLLARNVNEAAFRTVPSSDRALLRASKLPSFATVVVPPVLLRRNIFIDTQAGAGIAPGAAPPPPLGGAVVAGSARVGRRTYAVVQLSNGGTRRLPIGGTISGWRLVQLSETNAVFVRGRQRLDLPFGVQPSSDAQTDS